MSNEFKSRKNTKWLPEANSPASFPPVAPAQPSTIQWAPPGIQVQQNLPDGFHAARLTRSEFTHNPKTGNYTIKTEWTCENKARATIPLILFADQSRSGITNKNLKLIHMLLTLGGQGGEKNPDWERLPNDLQNRIFKIELLTHPSGLQFLDSLSFAKFVEPEGEPDDE